VLDVVLPSSEDCKSFAARSVARAKPDERRAPAPRSEKTVLVAATAGRPDVAERFFIVVVLFFFVVDRTVSGSTPIKHVCQESQLNILDTAHSVAHDYPGGCESLAPRVGMSAAVLRSKVNPQMDTHKLTLQDAVRITDTTNDERILEAWLAERNAVMVKLPTATEQPDNEEILNKFLKLTAHYGELAQRHSEATFDGVVDDQEMEDLERIGNLIHKAVEEINALTRRVYQRTPLTLQPTVTRQVA
jgi:Phage regulatory protein CII (CP76)